MLCFQLFVSHDTLGALNLYSGRLNAFEAQDRTTGLALAAHIAVALTSAQDAEAQANAVHGASSDWPGPGDSHAALRARALTGLPGALPAPRNGMTARSWTSPSGWSRAPCALSQVGRACSASRPEAREQAGRCVGLRRPCRRSIRAVAVDRRCPRGRGSGGPDRCRRGCSICSCRHVFEGSERVAREHADQVWSLERTLRLPSEARLQDWVLNSRHRRAHRQRGLPVRPLPRDVLHAVLLYVRRRDVYRWFRNVLLLTTGLALVGHIAYPLSPPRLEPAFGMVDTGLMFGQSTYAGKPGTGFTNQLAAMPSMHVAWAALDRSRGRCSACVRAGAGSPRCTPWRSSWLSW